MHPTMPARFPFRSLVLASAFAFAGCTAEEAGSGRSASIAQELTASDDIVLYARSATITSPNGIWRKDADTTAADGTRLTNPNLGGVTAPGPSTTDYIELTFTPRTGKDYRLWIRGRATGNAYSNDSMFVQFSNATTTSNQQLWRIGTTSALAWSLEESSSAGVSGWGWQDSSTWVTTGPRPLGPLLRFDSSAPQKIRISARQDGVLVDQVVLSGSTYLSRAPGSETNDATILSPERSADTSTVATGTLKVMTWNLHHIADPVAISTFVKNQNPDVAFFQEADSAKQASFVTTLQSVTGATWYANTRTDTGDLIVSRLPVSGWVVRNVGSASSWPGWRSAVHGEIRVGGVAVQLFGTHLDWPSTTYLSQNMDALVRFAGEYGGRKLVGGDFNAEMGSNSAYNSALTKLRSAGFTDCAVEAYGSDAAVPDTNGWRPDAIYRTTGLRTQSCRVVDVGSLSDHKAIIAMFAIE
jgi:endonuclease/exonuclease/phosphatase family metal-dependent hydrolase